MSKVLNVEFLGGKSKPFLCQRQRSVHLNEITKVGSRLIPDGFTGDKREVQDCLSKVSYILTVLGEKSAKAQGLQKVITSGEKLRNSDHVVYILIDPKGGSRGFGTVVGMLKIGVKHLYVFDASGNSVEVTTKCVLDFYVHESKQRMGLGKKLFQHMLKEERVDPVHLAIDKPSSKFLSFLIKHYGLQKIIPQMNNFVVFDGFFSNRSIGGDSREKGQVLAAGISAVQNRFSSGPTSLSPSPSSSSESHQFQSVSRVNLNNSSYYGRQAPHKPVSTMGMILQHKSAPSQQSTPNGSSTNVVNQTEISTPKTEEADENIEEVEMKNEEVIEKEDESQVANEVTPSETEESQPLEVMESDTKVSTPTTLPESLKSPSEAPPEKIRVNSQGYMDLKFYHSSLW